jgi:predicted small secreted protein
MKRLIATLLAATLLSACTNSALAQDNYRTGR